MTPPWLALVESNTTGSGRMFCARARDLGLRPVLLAADPGRYHYAAADGVDTMVTRTADPAAVLAACRRLGGQIAGVTSSSEYFIATAAQAAAALGLPHPEPGAVVACRDKHTQRCRLRAAGLPVPGFAAAGSPPEAVAAAGLIGYPVVVKPLSGSGSVGARRCATPADVAAAARYVLTGDPARLALPPQRAVLVEEYLTGPEYSVETLDRQAVGVTRKHLGAEPYFVETGHDFPAPLAEAARSALTAAALEALRALGLGWGGAHTELRLTPAGPRVVEVNPRLAGGMIPRLVQEALGVDLVWHVVARAAGRARVARPGRADAASIRFLVAGSEGRLAGVDGIDAARALPGVVEVAVTGRPGQQVSIRHSFHDRLGYVIARAGAGSVAARTAEAAVAALRLRFAAGVTEGSRE